MVTRLRPAHTLDEIYGPGLLYSPRGAPGARTWLPRDDTVLDLLTGGQMTVLGGMPLLCASAVSTPEALQLLRDAGFDAPADPFRYRDEDEYPRILSGLSGGARRIVVQHVHPASVLPPDRCWIPPSALSFLNNKGNLAELVDAPHLPARRVVESGRIARFIPASALPLVLKAITDESTGGGLDVAVCRTPADIGAAAELFRPCARVVEEKYMEFARDLCLNYAANADGGSAYLGCAEQVLTPDAKYRGNWIDPESEAPPAAVEAGARVVRAGAALGYRGCVGIDIGVLHDGRFVVYDLNFRVNGSTAAVLLAGEIRRVSNRSVLRFRNWVGRSAYRDMLDAAYSAMGTGALLPLASYDPKAGGFPDAAPRLSGLVLGATRGEVCERERELADLGLGD